MKRKRHEKTVFVKNRNNKILRNKMALCQAINNHFGYFRNYILNPEE